MSAGIKRMLADRAALEAEPRHDARLARLAEEQLGRIERAAPYIDEGCPANKWLPSALLKIGYCAIATAERPSSEADAVLWLHRNLELARQRFRGGHHPNPFAVQAIEARRAGATKIDPVADESAVVADDAPKGDA